MIFTIIKNNYNIRRDNFNYLYELSFIIFNSFTFCPGIHLAALIFVLT